MAHSLSPDSGGFSSGSELSAGAVASCGRERGWVLERRFWNKHSSGLGPVAGATWKGGRVLHRGWLRRGPRSPRPQGTAPCTCAHARKHAAARLGDEPDNDGAVLGGAALHGAAEARDDRVAGRFASCQAE